MPTVAGLGEAPARALVEQAYAALRGGDREALEALLAPDFEAEVAEGMPLGLGGHLRGPAAMIDTWWTIGRAFAVQPEAHEWIACLDGRLLVLGRYRGTARSTERDLDAVFAHLWTARDGQLAGLRQLTDTALWREALRLDSA